MGLVDLKKKLNTNIILALGGLCIAVAVGVNVYFNSLGNNAGFAANESMLIVVKPGMTTADIAELLHEKKLVANPKAFRYHAQWQGLDAKLQAGLYQLEGGSTNKEIIDTLAKGTIKTIRMTIPEGLSVVRLAKRLAREGLVDENKFLAAAKSLKVYPYMASDNPAIEYPCEGFLYPATYEVSVGSTEEELLQRLLDQFNKVAQEDKLKEQAEAQGKSLYEIVTMAAMVELEAVHEDEQARIAGVFWNRLDIDMPIQSDTTVQYLFGGEQKEVVLYKDLEIDSPYNTYKYPGLPPGPIASPGLAAMLATLRPEKTDYLYFVAKKDGYHQFSRSLAEHNEAIEGVSE